MTLLKLMTDMFQMILWKKEEENLKKEKKFKLWPLTVRVYIFTVMIGPGKQRFPNDIGFSHPSTCHHTDRRETKRKVNEGRLLWVVSWQTYSKLQRLRKNYSFSILESTVLISLYAVVPTEERRVEEKKDEFFNLSAGAYTSTRLVMVNGG